MKLGSKILKAVSALSLLATLNMAHAAFSPNDIQLGQPAYGGNGCPAGSASAVLSPDNKSLSILFDSFIVEAGGANATVSRKSCNVAIPVHVPQGYSLSIISVDYRGYVSLPAQAQARMTAEYFLAGSVGPRFDKQFLGKTDTDYTFTNDIGVQAQVNAAMLVQTNRYRDAALATVDSADFKAGLLYKLQWKTCR
jgi:hypothetical protein